MTHLLTDPSSTTGMYRGLLESLYAGMAALDTTDYRGSGATGGKWTQARYLGEGGGATADLEVLAELGAWNGRERAREQHDARLVLSLRATPDDTSDSQARAHSAAQAVRIWLEGWSYLGWRANPSSEYALDPVSSEWVRVTISFTLIRLRK